MEMERTRSLRRRTTDSLTVAVFLLRRIALCNRLRGQPVRLPVNEFRGSLSRSWAFR